MDSPCPISCQNAQRQSSTLNSGISQVENVDEALALDALGAVLYGLPILVLIICIAWFMTFIVSSQKGERLPLKWTEIHRARKALLGLIIAGIFLNFYLCLGNWLALFGQASLPFSWIYSIYAPALTWATTLSVFGLLVILSIRFPKRIVP